MSIRGFDCASSSAAERRKICSPWRKPWDQEGRSNAAPEGRNNHCCSHNVSPLRGWRMNHGLLPTAHAVGYRSFAAPRLERKGPARLTSWPRLWHRLQSVTSEVCATEYSLFALRYHRSLRRIIDATHFLHPAIAEVTFHNFITEQRQHSTAHEDWSRVSVPINA